MTVSRRDFLRAGATAAAAAALHPPRLLRAQPPRHAGDAAIDDPGVRELAMRALDAARAAGAAYADVRLSHVRDRSLNAVSTEIADSERLHVGVRALVDGYWGFASTAYWSADEVTRVAREATSLARTNALGRPRVVDLGPVAAVADGHWAMPIELDPFAVPVEEMLDLGHGLAYYTMRTYSPFPPRVMLGFARQGKAFASTDGTFVTQTLYRTGAGVSFHDRGGTERVVDVLTPAGRGWEYVRGTSLYEAVDAVIADATANDRLPVKPVEVGRYDVVFDAASMASLVDQTLAPATELDRAMGFEANAGGTSFLSDPLAMLGTFRVGSPALTLTADRSRRGGLATVKWDDEGVAPDDCTLVDRGVLVDYQTTRESAGWLRPWYAKAGRAQRSHGCASAPSAGDVTMLHRPNLAIAPARESRDFDALVAEMPAGIAFRSATARADFGAVGASGSGEAFEVRNGKRVARIHGAGFLFRTPELWKSLDAVGGAASQRWYGLSARKGEPEQEAWYSVGAVPGRVRQLTVIDIARKS